MKILVENRERYILLKLEGRLDVKCAEIFEEETDKVLNEYDKDIIIDCNSLEYISSSGLRVLLVFIKKLSHKQKKLSICCPNQNVMDVFTLSAFDKVVNIHPSLDEAEKII